MDMTITRRAVKCPGFTIGLLLLCLFLLWGSSPLLGFGLKYELTDTQFTAPATGVSQLLVDLPMPAEGFWVSVAHPPGLTLVSHGLAPSLIATIAVEFVQSGSYPGGATLFAVFDASPPFDGQLLPPGDDIPLVEFRYACAFPPPLPDPPLVFELEFVDGVFGTPPTNNSVVVGGLEPPITQFIPGSMTCMPIASFQPAFVRFDCNDDGATNIADPIFLAEYLFLGGNTPPCFEACESNLDGSIDLADVITQLGYHFAGGTPPPPPFPECGVAGPTLDCASFSSCP